MIQISSGDLIDVIAPSSGCKQHQLTKAVSLLQKKNFVVRVQHNILEKDFLCASSKENRALGLKKALCSNSKAVICLRGGYGAVHLASSLNKIKNIKKKIFIGSSDATIIHMLLNARGIPTLYSPMLNRISILNHRSEFYHLIDILTDKIDAINFKRLKLVNKTTNRLINAKIVGGNLSTIISSLGTPWQLKTRGKIIFLEDINEEAYKIDKMLNHLEHAGLFKGIRAMVLGDFIHKTDRNINKVISLFFKNYKFPVIKGLQVGHGKIQKVLPLNINSKLVIGSKINLSIPLK